MFLTIPVYGWLYFGKYAAGIVKITDPVALKISAANKEDIRYLSMSGLDLENEDGYKDFVFCIQGTGIDGYKIQLAYTTNNQFTFTLYSATKSDSMPGSYDGLVVYETHPYIGSSETQYYYFENGATAVNGTFLNKKSNEYAYTVGETASAPMKNYHEDTYEQYTEVHEQAEPLYWQTLDAIQVVNRDIMGKFCDYYIIRVSWPQGSTNTKETDIIYISARTATLGV